MILPDRLQAALSATHILERELRGGDMSRVLLATELALDRRTSGATPTPSYSPTSRRREARARLTGEPAAIPRTS